MRARLRASGLLISCAVACLSLGLMPVRPVAASPAVPAYDHIFFLIEENHSRAQIMSGAPFLASLANYGAQSSAYHAVTHPSVNNYLALFSGQTYSNINDQCTPGNSSCHTSAVNLSDEIGASGRTARGYMEDMPSACYPNYSSGKYVVRHNPFPYFDQIRTTSRCAREVVPYTQLASDLASTSTTPNFVWITPNLTNDMHDGSIAQGDQWAQSNLPTIFHSPAWKTQHCLLVVTFDEDDGSAQNNVYFAAAGSDGSAKPGYTSTVTSTAYSWLRTIETAWGLAPMTPNDSAAQPMTDLFTTPNPLPGDPAPSQPPAPPPPPPPGCVPNDPQGYWLTASDGGVFPIGRACGYGSTGGMHLNKPIAGMAPTPGGRGYWLVAADGGIFPFGDATGYGSAGGSHLNAPIVGMAPTHGGRGYWLVATDGGIFPFGDAVGYGSLGGTTLNKPIVGITSTPGGRGYWLVAGDGGVFPFGDAVGYGSTGGTQLNRPIIDMASTASGHGYWMVAADGGVFPFGDAVGYGSTGGTQLNQPIVGISTTASGRGYWLAAADGGIFPFGDAGGYGSMGGIPLNRPVITVAGLG